MGVTRNEMLALVPNIIPTRDEVISTIQFLVHTKLIIPVGILDIRSENCYSILVTFTLLIYLQLYKESNAQCS